MNVIKIATGLACGFLILLFSSIILIENPEKKHFDQTVESLMLHEDFCSLEEVLDAYPELKEIKLKIERTIYLNSMVRSMTGGPSPDLSEEQSQEVQKYKHEIRQLRKAIKERLFQLKAIYAEVQP